VVFTHINDDSGMWQQSWNNHNVQEDDIVHHYTITPLPYTDDGPDDKVDKSTMTAMGEND